MSTQSQNQTTFDIPAPLEPVFQKCALGSINKYHAYVPIEGEHRYRHFSLWLPYQMSSESYSRKNAPVKNRTNCHKKVVLEAFERNFEAHLKRYNAFREAMGLERLEVK